MATPVVPGATFRDDFPKGFLFGASTSAFQIEGAVNEGGRGPSIWDTYAREQDGKISGGKNVVGITFYNNLIDELLAAGITPIVTLSHWDIPQGLDDEYGGFLSPQITKDFVDYANLCFTEFGDRVRYWITFCGPWSLAYTGYGTGTIAPGRGASSSTVETFAARSLLPPDLTFCQPYRTRIHRDASGDPGTEPYLVAHHQLLAHAAVVKLYRDNYQVHEARSLLTKPVAFGEQYLYSMKDFIGSRLRPFTDEESLMVKGSYDFIALNYYTASYVRDAPEVADGPPSVVTDPRIAFEKQYLENCFIAIMLQGGSSWIRVYPAGIKDFLAYVKNKYDNPVIYISENGIDERDDPSLTRWESLTDHRRVSYYQKHLSYLKRAITEDEVKVKGYFIWSLTDNFEWDASIYSRFGNAYIDYDKGYARHPKLSAEWFRVHLLKPSQ
ncbi:hypothetical protein RJ639_021902, partial [Escallonia herrerae]